MNRTYLIQQQIREVEPNYSEKSEEVEQLNICITVNLLVFLSNQLARNRNKEKNS